MSQLRTYAIKEEFAKAINIKDSFPNVSDFPNSESLEAYPEILENSSKARK